MILQLSHPYAPGLVVTVTSDTSRGALSGAGLASAYGLPRGIILPIGKLAGVDTAPYRLAGIDGSDPEPPRQRLTVWRRGLPVRVVVFQPIPIDGACNLDVNAISDTSLP